MNIKVPNSQQIGSWLRQAAAVAGLIISIGNQANQPVAMRGVIGFISGALLLVEHYVGDPSTGTTNNPPTTDTGKETYQAK